MWTIESLPLDKWRARWSDMTFGHYWYRMQLLREEYDRAKNAPILKTDIKRDRMRAAAREYWLLAREAARLPGGECGRRIVRRDNEQRQIVRKERAERERKEKQKKS